MKNTLLALLGFILLSTPLAATAQQSGDFTYSSDGSAITISGYTGPGGAVNIPDTMIGLPVAKTGDVAFQSRTSVTRVTFPGSVTSIGDEAFHYCTNLTSVTIQNGVANAVAMRSRTAPASSSSLFPLLFAGFWSGME